MSLQTDNEFNVMLSTVRIISLSVLCLLIVYFFVFQIQAIWAFTIDDMYITLRYAHQWALHGSIVWNLGDAPVEGYSNFSFVLLARLCEILHLDPVLGLKAVSILSLIASCIGVFLITAHWIQARYACIPVIWLLAYRGEIIWAVSGLETTFYQSILIFSVYSLLRGLHYQARREICIAGLLLALLGLTRPEGGIVACCCLVILGRYAFKRPALRPLFYSAAGVFGVVYLPYLVWRLFYFGYLFPNSVYCKASSQQFLGVLDKQYFRLIWPFLCCLLPLLRVRSPRLGYSFLIMPTLLYSLLCGTADPIVAFDNRLFLPAFALLLPLAAVGLSQMIQQQWFVYVMSAVLLVFCVPKMSLQDYRYFTTNPLAGERLRHEVSRWLEKHATSNQHVVLADSGLIPYQHAELRFIDSYCLNNVEMAHTNTQDRYVHFCETILEKRPDYIILTAWIHEGQIEYTPADTCISARLSHAKEYQLVNVFRSHSQDRSVYQYQAYAKR